MINIYMATNSICQQWLTAKDINPLTGKKLLKDSKTYMQLIKKCLPLGPTTGDEPKYDPTKWNKPYRVEAFNCYDYAFDNDWEGQKNRSQPGMISGQYKKDGKQIHQCGYMTKILQTDHPELKRSDFKSKCPKNHYKLGLMVDPVGESTDYHFIRQDKDGLWSHKIGDLPVDNVDADGNIIHAPHLANFQYPKYKYKDYCGYFCAPKTSKHRFKSRAVAKLTPIEQPKTANASKKNSKNSNASRKNSNASKKNSLNSNASKKNSKNSNASKKNSKNSNASKKNSKNSNASKKNSDNIAH
jgi:antitoxin (DNA-binding transcriptional repressor) of toxin-antitoxin stability system